MATSSLVSVLFFCLFLSWRFRWGLKKNVGLFSHANILFYMQSLTSWNILTDSLFFNTVGRQCKEAATLRQFLSCSKAEVHHWISLESHLSWKWHSAKFFAAEELLAFLFFVYIYFFAAQDTAWSCDSDIVYYVLTALGGLYSDNFFAFCTALSDQYEAPTYSWRFRSQRDCDAPKRSALCRRYCDCLRVCDAYRATCLIQHSPSKDIWLIQRWSWREARLWCSCWLSAPALV